MSGHWTRGAEGQGCGNKEGAIEAGGSDGGKPGPAQHHAQSMER